MGAYDSAQVADLIGIYILDTLDSIVSTEQMGLYRDEGNIFISDSNGSKTSKTHKKIIKALKLLGLWILKKLQTKIVGFLDVTLGAERLFFGGRGMIPQLTERFNSCKRSKQKKYIKIKI